MKRYKILIAIFAIFLISLALFSLIAAKSGTRRTPLDKIVIADGSQPLAAAIYAAISEGYFKEEGLDVTLRTYSYGKPAIQSLLSGESNFATVAETPFVQMILQGEKPAVLTTLGKAENSYAVLALTESGIRTPADLRGKKI